MSFVLAHLLSLIGFVMAIWLVARAGEQRRPTGSLVAWLFAILLVPMVGVPLYLVFGGRKLARRAASKVKLARSTHEATAADGRLAAMLCRSGAAAPSRGNQLTLLATGEAAFGEIRRIISGARSVIHISTLILADDEVGRALAELLIERARAGVEVRVLVDALFEFRSSRRLVAELRAAGVKLAWFMPLFSPWQRRRINLRLHRKVVLVDGAVGIIGGMNLAREYMGPTPWPGRWRDLSLRVEGPAVGDMVGIFVSDWRFASGEVLPEPAALAAAQSTAVARAMDSGASAVEAARALRSESPDSVQIVGSGPDAESDRIYDALLSGIFDARRRLWIATPYFVPDEPLLRALILAVRRGVDVRVVVPRRSNHLTADWAGGSSLRELAREGGVVRCYAPSMLHAKLVLIDEEIAIVGSANIDMRSLFLNYEIALVLTSALAASELDAWFRDVLSQCVELEPAGRVRAILEPVARLLAPLE